MSASRCSVCPREARQLRRGLCGACYERTRKRQTAYGRWTPDRVVAEPVRAHVDALNAAGISKRQLAKLAGIDRSVLATLLHGKPGRPPAAWITSGTAQKILAIAIPCDPTEVAADRHRIPAVGARRRLRALVSAGWPMSHLAAELGVTPSNFGPLIHGRSMVTVRRHRDVVALFDRLQLNPGPSMRARNYGLKKHWPLPMQWDEEAIDDPTATAAVKRRPAPRPKRAAA